MKPVTLLLSLILLSSCSSRNSQSVADNVGKQEAWRNTATPGTIVAADSMKVPDPLNEYYFSVKVLASSESDSGKYDLHVAYANNEARTSFALPKGGKETLLPAVRKGPEPFSYIVGFHKGTDTAFHDYVLVEANKGQTKMKYLKAYFFE
jgi:hypothetical protein